MKRMKRWLRPSALPAAVLFLAMGVFGGAFAWVSYNLIFLFMANFHFISEHGLVALEHGGLRQAVELVGAGYCSVALYLGFRVCEEELIARIRRPAAAPRVTSAASPGEA